MIRTSPHAQGCCRRLRQDDDSQRHDRAGSPRRHHDGDRPERRRQIDDVQDDLRSAAGAQRHDYIWRARHHQFLAAPDARCRRCLHPAGPQHLPGAQRSPQSGIRRRRAVRSIEPAGAARPDHAALSDVEGQGRRAGLDAVGRPAEIAGSRARPVARSQADIDRRAVDRPVAADGAGGVRHPQGSCATRASPSC